MPVDSATIKQWLHTRHESDIYAEEALTGSGGSQRFDFWAMEPTWQRIHCSGYEVKVNRRDFVADKKWRNYLPYCTEFYFVCPHGLIQPDEIPKEAGLIYCPKEGGHLYTKKKAPDRDIKPENLCIMLQHVLMWRHKVNNGWGKHKAERWLNDMKSNRELDYTLKDAIKKAAGKRTEDIHKENERLRHQNDSLEYIKDWAKSNDFELDKTWRTREKLEEIRTGIDPKLSLILSDSKSLKRELEDLIKAIEPPAKVDDED